MIDTIKTTDTLAQVEKTVTDTTMTIEKSFSQALDAADSSIGISKLTDKGYDAIINYGPKLLLAIVVLLVGLWIIKMIVKGFTKMLNKRKVDDSLKPFFRSLVSIGLKAMLVISVMGMVGIEMTSFIAVLGAVGLAVGMALSGTLQNFAGGVMILIFKPFRAGDVIDAQGHTGKVKEIQIFNTILTTPDNKTIIIPNGGLSTGSMTNFSKEPQRRVDWSFGIGYGDDLKKAKTILEDLINAEERILDDPKHFIALGEMADSSVNITVRVWVKSEDYWDVFFDMNEKVFLAFNEKGINIPYPQMDVHLHKAE